MCLNMTKQSSMDFRVNADSCCVRLNCRKVSHGLINQQKSARIGGVDDNVFYASYIPEDFDSHKAVDNIEIRLTVKHNYKETEFAPTCTQPGYIMNICEECGDSYTDITEDSSGHTWKYEPIEDGEQFICETCGAADVTYFKEIPHNFDNDFTVDKPATFDNDGSKSQHCNIPGCKAVRNRQEIPALSHIELDAKSFVYNGEVQKPEVKVISRDSKTTLNPEQDYDLTYSEDSTNAGKKTVTVTFKGEYAGEATENYEICSASLAGNTLALSEKSGFIFIGNDNPLNSKY